MRSAFIALLLALVPFGSVAQDSPLKPDGRMWANFGTAGQGIFIKGAYVQGVIEGLRSGAARGYVRGRMDAGSDVFNYVKQCADKGHPCADIASLADPGKGWSEGLDKLDSEVSPQHISAQDIVHQMDNFYADYRNTPVCMIHAIQESIQSLKGTASTEQGLAMMRKGCDPK